ncbi:MAG: hypothetical protein CMK07_11580 [Ponticaulis sp.]|nr:hypothetical protein [Ponticaulis sp.]|tara:strand:+ start:289 stop:777 length:489 start_codon:yes stop_codon:yes gene_type:complete
MPETLTPIMKFGAFPQELVDFQFQWAGAFLQIDLFPRHGDYASVDPESEAEALLGKLGAQKLKPADRYLRLTFTFVEALVVSQGVEMDAHALNWETEPDDHPAIAGQDWPYALFLVEGSNWDQTLTSPGMNHYRINGPFCRADILAYEPDGNWIDNTDKVAP